MLLVVDCGKTSVNRKSLLGLNDLKKISNFDYCDIERNDLFYIIILIFNEI